MVNTQLLEKTIAESGKKKQYLAEKCGIDRHSLSNKINNRSEFTGTQLRILCQELGVNQFKKMDEIFFASLVPKNGN